jgi:exopolysaccharide biosynthesis predicted pyruvyltransferase EpsI
VLASDNTGRNRVRLVTQDRVALLGDLRNRIDDVIAEVVPPGAPVALVNFPNHRNAGDSAIWMGAERVLRDLDRPVRYRASWASYEPTALKRAAPEGPILLNGGGNLGDAYVGPRSQQGTRERVLADFPGRLVVQLPQSTWFRSDDARSAMARRLAAHGNTILLLRDEASLAYASAAFPTQSLLCPDLALALDPRPRPTVARSEVLWLARRDGESAGYEPPRAAGVEVVDWLEPLVDEPDPSTIDAAWLRWNERMTERAHTDPRAARRWGRVLARSFGPLARYWVDRGCRILARGEVVITDRLHGHVLALLMGIPHVVLANTNGKIESFLDTWTGSVDGVARAADPDAALARARSLASGDRA